MYLMYYDYVDIKMQAVLMDKGYNKIKAVRLGGMFLGYVPELFNVYGGFYSCFVKYYYGFSPFDVSRMAMLFSYRHFD